MPRDKKDNDHFLHSPFKTLRGLSVSETPKKVTEVPSGPVKPSVQEGDEGELFAREMDWLNVRPVGGEKAKVIRAAGAASSVSTVDDNTAEFLSAVGKLDKTFRDELSSGEEPLRARPRRLKQLERGELKLSGELDLHGLTRDEALARTRGFLGHSARQGWLVVLIVTGKGLHSPEGPVLRQAVERLLDESRDLILEWGVAPRRFGGAGALVVFVRVKNRG